MHAEAVGRLVLSADIRKSAQLGDRAKLGVRRVMYEVLDSAFAAVGVGDPDRQQEDRGDGILAVLSPSVPPARIVGPWVERVYEGLRVGNEDRREPVRLRVAMHVGPVFDDGRGRVGRAVDLACRLCDSEALRQTLEAAVGYDLVVAVSAYLYDSTVRHGGEAVEPDRYLPARVQVKETQETAWIQVPRLPVPPVPANLRGRDEGAGPDADRSLASPPAPDRRSAPGGDGARQQPGAPKYLITTGGGPSTVIEGSIITGGHFGNVNHSSVTEPDEVDRREGER